MLDNLSDIKNKINELAEELVTLDSKTQKAQITSIQGQIRALFLNTEFACYRTDERGNDWYNFPLLDNLCAPFETTFKVLNENLRKSKRTWEADRWIFNPEAGDFITTVIRKTKFKIERKDSLLKGYLQTEEDTDSDGAPTGIVKDYADPIDYMSEADERIDNRQRVEYVANMIICQSWVENGRKNKQHFEGFFTHDRVTEERKTEGAYITNDYSNIIFPAMSITLLEYLMEGSFSHMRDLVRNKVRDFIDLSQCIKNVGDCFKMSSPKYYHVKYKQWLVSINPYNN